MSNVTLAEQVKVGDTIALDDGGETLDMSLTLDEQTASWDAVKVCKVIRYPAVSMVDIFLTDGYRFRMGMGQEVFVL